MGTDNGVNLACEIRRTSDVAIIMVTGKDDLIDRVVGLEVPVDLPDSDPLPFPAPSGLAGWKNSGLIWQAAGACSAILVFGVFLVGFA